MADDFIEEQNLTRCKTYFDLINKVGSKGVYQRNIFLMVFANWFIGAFILLGTSFLFLNPKFDCEAHGIQTGNCEAYICNTDIIPQNQRRQYIRPKEVNSLATEFGQYYCQDNIKLSMLKMVTFLGTFFGYTVILSVTDNLGRRLSIIMAWAATTVGILLVCMAVNMPMAVVGLFFAGAGCQSCIRISMSIFSQIVEYYKRQRYSIAVQISFGAAGIMVGVVYWIFREWRIVQIAFCGIPAVILLIFMICYLQETPKFLLKQGKEKAIRALNRIGKINTGQDNLITQQDIDNVLEQLGEDQQMKHKIMTPLDLFRYPSLRSTTIIFGLLFFLITFVYFGPIIIVDKLGFNSFLSQIILSASELIAYPIAFCFIERIGRRFIGQVMFGLSAIFTGILIFVHPPQGCDNCAQGIIQIILVFGSRFCVSFYFSVLFLYVVQSYPLRVRGIGFGICSAAGAIASTSSTVFLGFLEERGINPMVFFTMFAVFAMVCLNFAEETHNKPLKDQVDEIQLKKDETKRLREQELDQKDVGESDSNKHSEDNYNRQKDINNLNGFHSSSPVNNGKDKETELQQNFKGISEKNDYEPFE